MTPAVAFRFWPRRTAGPRIEAPAGTTITLDDRIEYVVAFQRPLSPVEMLRLREVGGEVVEPDLAVLSFGNFVGRTHLAGVGIEVASTKIGQEGVSRILQAVSDLASSLVFGWRAPTGFGAAADPSHHAPVPYHQLQLLRRSMLGERPGYRLQDWLAAIERNATRRFEPERPPVPPDSVRRLDQRAVRSVFSRLERLVPVPSGSAIADNRLARKLTFGRPPSPHFPALVAAPRGRLSFDTAENRFVKHVVGECISLVHRFVGHTRLHEGLRADCRTMLATLEQAATALFLVEAGRLTAFQAPSQALAKANGYREVFAFWTDLTRHVSLPASTAETTRLLEGRDMATLYEYWVFLKVLEATVAVTGWPPVGRPTIHRDEFGESLGLGLQTKLGQDITVSFNPTFKRSAGTAYSTPLRPDVTVRIGGTLHAFDAKYRLDRFDAAEGDPDEGAATYKRADLYKMHTYRDAICGLRTAFIVYPGTEFVFFERSGMKRSEPAEVVLADGVGAVPLRPADEDPAANLRAVLRALLTLPGTAAAS